MIGKMITVSFLFLFAVCIITTDACAISASYNKEVRKLLCEDYDDASQFIKLKIINNWNKEILGVVTNNYEAPEDVLESLKVKSVFRVKMDSMPKDANSNAYCYAKVLNVAQEKRILNPGDIVCGNSISKELKAAEDLMETYKESRKWFCV